MSRFGRRAAQVPYARPRCSACAANCCTAQQTIRHACVCSTACWIAAAAAGAPTPVLCANSRQLQARSRSGGTVPARAERSPPPLWLQCTLAVPTWLVHTAVNPDIPVEQAFTADSLRAAQRRRQCSTPRRLSCPSSGPWALSSCSSIASVGSHGRQDGPKRQPKPLARLPRLAARSVGLHR